MLRGYLDIAFQLCCRHFVRKNYIFRREFLLQCHGECLSDEWGFLQWYHCCRRQLRTECLWGKLQYGSPVLDAWIWRRQISPPKNGGESKKNED